MDSSRKAQGVEAFSKVKLHHQEDTTAVDHDREIDGRDGSIRLSEPQADPSAQTALGRDECVYETARDLQTSSSSFLDAIEQGESILPDILPPLRLPTLELPRRNSIAPFLLSHNEDPSSHTHTAGVCECMSFLPPTVLGSSASNSDPLAPVPPPTSRLSNEIRSHDEELALEAPNPTPRLFNFKNLKLRFDRQLTLTCPNLPEGEEGEDDTYEFTLTTLDGMEFDLPHKFFKNKKKVKLDFSKVEPLFNRISKIRMMRFEVFRNGRSIQTLVDYFERTRNKTKNRRSKRTASSSK